MNLISVQFLLFCAIVVIVFYAVPKRFQWIVLLAASLYFYWTSGNRNILFVLITSISTYFAACGIQKSLEYQKAWVKEHKGKIEKSQIKAFKEKCKKQQKTILVLTLVLNFGLLCVFKYLHFAVEQINQLITSFGGATAIPDAWSLIVPLGISFYTFQTMGYLVDVYLKKTSAETNYFKVLLFVSFFPQMTQGPISNFKFLTTELFKEHTFTYRQYSWGVQRMIWGFFKKIVIADWMSVFVNDVFQNYPSYTGITTLIGAFMYSVQIYADFSGYMDIVCGFCEILGIRLTENFNRPYFSKSIAEYWRRWHISLGAWFKTYIYYPIALSKWNQKLGKRLRKVFGKKVGQTMPASIALVVVWLVTGLWHGASWAYIAWGGVNGIFIIFSLWMEPVYDSWKRKLHIKENSFYWRAFMTIRTFVLVTFIKVLPEVGSLQDGFGLWKQIFTNHVIPHDLHQLLPFAHSKFKLLALAVSVLLIFITSMIQRKQPIRQWLEDHTHYVTRLILFAFAIIIIIHVESLISDVAGGFLYEQF
ncbi:MAG: MBOAT family protein [Lachnospiraceae bacterium]|nr:MBOAT family protein [Lachnospiraceae bacterium]